MGNLFRKVFEVNTSAQEDALWRIISSTSRIPQFWHGTRWIKIIDGKRYQIRFAFPAKGVVDFIYDSDRKTAKEIYVKGNFAKRKERTQNFPETRYMLSKNSSLLISKLQ